MGSNYILGSWYARTGKVRRFQTGIQGPHLEEKPSFTKFQYKTECSVHILKEILEFSGGILHDGKRLVILNNYMDSMALPVVVFSRQGYKIRKVFG